VDVIKASLLAALIAVALRTLLTGAFARTEDAVATALAEAVRLVQADFGLVRASHRIARLTPTPLFPGAADDHAAAAGRHAGRGARL
jgi:hypothetical protein